MVLFLAHFGKPPQWILIWSLDTHILNTVVITIATITDRSEQNILSSVFEILHIPHASHNPCITQSSHFNLNNDDKEAMF